MNLSIAGTGTAVNSAAIILGCIIGLFFKKLISEKMNAVLMQALGLCTLTIGLCGVVQGGMKVLGGELSSQNTMVMIGCMVLGTVFGELLDIDRRLEELGDFVQNKFAGNTNNGKTNADAEGEKTTEGGSFSKGFVTATLTVCVGAMAIVGSLNDGLRHDPSVLYAKSVLDFVICIIFASTLGAGAMLSALSVAIYQGGITLFASLLEPCLTAEAVGQMSFIGNILIMGIGLNFLYKPRLKLANMLPAVFLPIVWQVLQMIFKL